MIFLHHKSFAITSRGFARPELFSALLMLKGCQMAGLPFNTQLLSLKIAESLVFQHSKSFRLRWYAKVYVYVCVCICVCVCVRERERKREDSKRVVQIGFP
jgi:hypothetical protein